MNPAVYYLSSLDTNIPYIPTPVEIPNGQIWDQYNLNTSVYSDRTLIPRISVSGVWPTLTTGACRFYDNDSNNANLYGRLYNWYAVNGIDGTGIIKDIAPAGWRVATLDDWQALSTYYGGNTVSSGPLKEFGTTYWLSPNTGAVVSPNLFRARGGGFAAATASNFLNIKSSGYWWPFGAADTDNLVMTYNSAVLSFNTTGLPTRGYSVRLIKKDIVIDGFTTTLSSYDANSIETGGDIPTSYDQTISDKGIVWGTSPNPNIIGQIANKMSSGSGGTGSYAITISGLTPSITYYIRAYAIVTTGPTQGTAYAVQQTVTLQSALASISTNSITSIEATSAVSGGNITYINSEYPVITSGLVWSTSINPIVTLNTKTTDGPTGTTTGSFSSTMTGLLQVTHYYVRAYATTSFGTAYGANVEFETIAGTVLLYAFSLRRVVAGYTGPAIRVRNGGSSSSPQFDVGFDANGNLDIYGQFGLLTQMTSANIGYVNKWYDQNGSGKFMGNSAQSREPVIVNVGKVLVTKTGPNGQIRPATNWGAPNCQATITGVSIQVANISNFIVCSNNTSTVNQRGIVMSGYIFPRVVSGTSDSFFYNSGIRFSMGTTSSATKVYSNLTTSTTAYAWKNNSLVGTYIGNGTATSTSVLIGINPTTGSEEFNGTIQEILFYTGDLSPSGVNSRSTITTTIMDYYGINP